MGEIALGYQLIRGQVEIAAYDLDGSVLAVELRDSAGSSFLIADNPRGESLLRLVGRSVVASGYVSRECFGYLVSVEKFVVV